MKSISFGPVTHKDKSYAYALGYGAYMMGHSILDCPYRDKSDKDTNDYEAGWVEAKRVVEERLTAFIEEHQDA